MGHPGMMNPNAGQPVMGRPLMPNQGMSGQGMPNQGMPGRGMQGPGMPGQGMPNANMRPPVMGHPGMQQPNMGNPNQGQPGMFNRGNPNQNMRMPSQADMASNRLAREIEKSVKGDGRNGGSEGGPGLRRAGASGAGRIGIAIPANITESLSSFSAYIFGGILIICLIISLAAYCKDHKGGVSGKKVSLPTEMFTYTGIFRNAYEAAAAGTLNGSGAGEGGSVLYNDDGTMVPPPPQAAGEGESNAVDPDDFDPSAVSSGSSEEAGTEASGSDTSGSYGQAESYKELLDQLQKAIASGDSAFVASKMAYEDESGTLKAFPQTVVDHFVSYMSTNTDKLSSLMTDLSSDKYSGQNDGEFIVKLPYIKFVVNMGYDNTTVSIPGFSEQVVNAGQSADIAPLMPCMYTLTISNPDWNDVVTRDIEANINESTISINIKP